MSIVIFSKVIKAKPWIDALKGAAPDVEILTYDQVRDKEKVLFALAWDHPRGIFKEYPNLKCISSMGAGVDHIMSDPDIPEQVEVVRIADPLLSQDLAEFALSVVMNHMRGLTHYQNLQHQKTWKKRMYKRISDVRAGVMGTGVIGDHVVKFLLSSGFSVTGWGKSPGKKEKYKRFHGIDQLDEFLSTPDILICLLPLTPETRGILNKRNLEKLPRGAFVINLGRGPHVVDQDLMEMIDKGHLSGAHLDVFAQEPLPPGHPFWSHPSIHITPHVASITTPKSVAPQIIENYRRALRDEELLNVVDRKKGY